MNVAKFIEDFIKVVSSNLGVPLLNISNGLLNSRLKEFKSCVSRLPSDVRVIGICGMRGIGKTTLARAYFDDMSSQFVGSSSFLANVRQVCEKEHNGLEKLQEQLLTDTLIGEHKVNNVYEGIGMISQRLCRKKVLVILDDVDQLNQVEGLAEKTNWFGSGSRIILTTTDESLLSIYGEEEYIIHKVDILEYSEALRLFSSKAFRSADPPEDYKKLSEEVMEYANGLPLALVVLGSFLRRISINLWRSAQKKEEVLQIWRSALDRLHENPNTDITKVLQISFDALEETEKSIFLDIACFFNGDHEDYITKIMDSCGFSPEIFIRSLVDKSLLHMDHDNTLRMHDLLEEMGKEIVRGKSRNEPGGRSRIWLWDDFYRVMDSDKGTEKVEAIVCHSAYVGEKIRLRSFSNMKKIRLLIVSNLRSDSFDYLSNELRFLQWSAFTSNWFPPSFQPDGLVELRLPDSRMLELWRDPIKPLYNLKSINLTYSRYFCKLEFSMFPNLEELILDYCGSLPDIDPSITTLKRLTLLSLIGCRRLESLPSMEGLESLKVLNLDSCSCLANLPEDLGCLNNLEKLVAIDSGIRDLPSSIRDLKALKSLECFNCSYDSPARENILKTIVGNGPSSAGLYSFEKLNLSLCRLSDGAFPDDFGCLVSLECLVLCHNNFSCLPAHFNQLSKLRDLDLSRCNNLTSLGPELPDSLETVRVYDCWELHTFLDPLSQCNLRCSRIDCVDCFKLVNRQGSKRTAITSLQRYLQNPPSPSKRFDIVLPGNEIPSWFTRQVKGGSSISLPLHPNWCTNKWMGFALSVCFANESFGKYIWQIKINQQDWGFGDVCYLPLSDNRENHRLWLLYLPRDTYFHAEWHNKSGHIQFSLKIKIGEKSKEFKQCGVRLVYEQDIEELNLTAIHEPIEPPDNEFFYF